jgi:hypothetical protein
MNKPQVMSYERFWSSISFYLVSSDHIPVRLCQDAGDGTPRLVDAQKVEQVTGTSRVDLVSWLRGEDMNALGVTYSTRRYIYALTRFQELS